MYTFFQVLVSLGQKKSQLLNKTVVQTRLDRIQHDDLHSVFKNRQIDREIISHVRVTSANNDTDCRSSKYNIFLDSNLSFSYIMKIHLSK